MISFDSFGLEEGIPIYQQIIIYLKRGMVSGQIRDGDEMPSRRLLSARLGVNPNTIQKAYHLLEEEGLILSRSGAKSYVVLTEQTVETVRRELVEGEIRSLVSAMAQMGLSRQEALTLVEKHWPSEESL